MPHDDHSASDSLRVAARVLSPDDPNNPRNPEFIARAAKAAQPAAPPPPPAQPRPAAPAPAAPAPQAKPQPPKAAEPQQPPKKRVKRHYFRRPRAPLSPAAAEEQRIERHQRACTVCNHRERSEIDQEFLDWIHPESIAHHYKIDWRAVYRHAHATGLFPARQRNLRAALNQVVEKAARIEPTVDGLLRAMRAFSSLDREGRWTEIPTHVVVSSGAQLAQSNLIGESLKTLTLRSVSRAADDESPAAPAETAEPAESLFSGAPESEGRRRLLDNDSK